MTRVQTTVDIATEILIWSRDRPSWQRDALRRLFSAEGVTPPGLDDLAQLCKAARGLAEPATPRLLTTEHLATKTTSVATSLVALTHHRGANALAAEQTMTFGQHLTVVFGQNAAGKSGYARILKKACRSRFVEEIHGNLLSDSAPMKLQATITFRQGAQEVSTWTADSPPSNALASVSVFDARCAPVYLRGKTDVAFRPFGLDIFDQLAALCGEVRKRLESERAWLINQPLILPTLPEGTRARRLLDHLTAFVSTDQIRALATLTEEDQSRLLELQARHRDLLVADPRQRAQEINARADRVDLLCRHVADLYTTFRGSTLAGLKASAEALRVAQETLDLLKRKALTTYLLPGTGDDRWREMWDATEAFSKNAYPDSPFPALGEGARCPFCQQEIGSDAIVRLRHLAEYVASTVQSQAREAAKAYHKALSDVRQAVIRRAEFDLTVSALRLDNPPLAQEVEDFFRGVELIQSGIEDALSSQLGFILGMNQNPEASLRSEALRLRDRSKQLLAEKPAMSPEDAGELKDLEARVKLAEHLQVVLDEIERQKRLVMYDQCIKDTFTQAITRKSTELTSRLITDQLRAGFQEELERLGFDHLAVEIQEAGGNRGALFHKLAFRNAPEVAVSHVLSEGEARTLALASFLTELKTCAQKSAIIFDDPVSSLDHVWRERIARRLAAEAEDRQVVVFTHDLLFLRILSDEAARLGIDCKEQYVRRGEVQVGLCSQDLPSFTLNTTKRIARMRSKYQDAEKLSRNEPDKYEEVGRSILQLVRDAWEQAIAEVLLADVVQRYRPSIETKKVRFLHDITLEDCRAVDVGMTETSRWLHDQPLADGAPFPPPGVLKQRIDDLADWVTAIRNRRQNVA